MTPQAIFTISRKADRAALADLLCAAFARVPGVIVERENEEPENPFRNRQISIVAHADFARFTVELDGDSNWGVLGHWNLDYSRRAGRLFTPGFQVLMSPSSFGRAHHKANGPVMGNIGRPAPISQVHAEVFAATVNRGLRKCMDGSAFEVEQVRGAA